jgi:hypothetical protein
MYRDDELAASLQIPQVEEKLSAMLEGPVRRLRYWRHSHAHPLSITVIFYIVVILFSTIAGYPYDESTNSWTSDNSSRPGTALLIGSLITSVVGGLFVGLNALLIKRRVDDFYANYGPPPKNLKPTERLRILEGRLEELQALLSNRQQGD